MKKSFYILIATIFITSVFYSAASASGYGNGITQSPHDFSNESWNPSKELCRVCHVPHDHGRGQYSNGLLWNHGVSSKTYTMYDNAWSDTLTGTQSAQPDGTSKLCLGCHDGSVAIDTFDKYAGGAWYMEDENLNLVIPRFTDGTNLDFKGTHPLSIEFPAGEIGTEFNDPAVAAWYGGSTVASTLDNNKIQCTTCHDVHDQESVPGTNLLRAPQTIAQGGTPSQLCLICHIK